MKVVATFEEARELAGGRAGLVPTMGSFHEGHLELMRRARRDCDTLTVSLYVNPLQFAPDEDLDTYPRDLAKDVATAEDEEVDVLFAPDDAEVYRDAPSVSIDAGAMGTVLEGRSRPGFFAGVSMAVAKLFAGLRPDVAYFGRKDAQQLAVVRRLVRDLSFPVEIGEAPTIRECDGLALSSRNRYLGPKERRAATALSQGLLAAADAIDADETAGAVLERTVADRVGDESLLDLDYASLVDAATVSRISHLDGGRGVLAAAASVGGVRLIDNIFIDGMTPDRGIHLTGRSIIYEEG